MRPDALLVLGYCGATRDEIEVGHLVIADRVLYGERGIVRELALNRSALERAVDAAAGMAYHVGPVETFDRPVIARSGVSRDAVAVDMESFAVAHTARAYHIPATIVRAVSDVVPDRFSLRGLWSHMRHMRDQARKAMRSSDAFVAGS
jgi:nucleoside phosphorylase